MFRGRLSLKRNFATSRGTRGLGFSQPASLSPRIFDEGEEGLGQRAHLAAREVDDVERAATQGGITSTESISAMVGFIGCVEGFCFNECTDNMPTFVTLPSAADEVEFRTRVFDGHVKVFAPGVLK